MGPATVGGDAEGNGHISRASATGDHFTAYAGHFKFKFGRMG